MLMAGYEESSDYGDPKLARRFLALLVVDLIGVMSMLLSLRRLIHLQCRFNS
jgi:hypothetical protein